MLTELNDPTLKAIYRPSCRQRICVLHSVKLPLRNHLPVKNSDKKIGVKIPGNLAIAYPPGVGSDALETFLVSMLKASAFIIGSYIPPAECNYYRPMYM